VISYRSRRSRSQWGRSIRSRIHITLRLHPNNVYLCGSGSVTLLILTIVTLFMPCYARNLKVEFFYLLSCSCTTDSALKYYGVQNEKNYLFPAVFYFTGGQRCQPFLKEHSMYIAGSSRKAIYYTVFLKGHFFIQ
jgi:hypothetical protein